MAFLLHPQKSALRGENAADREEVTKARTYEPAESAGEFLDL